MRIKFDEQLRQLNTEKIRMGNMIEKAIQSSIEAFFDQDVETAQQIHAFQKIGFVVRVAGPDAVQEACDFEPVIRIQIDDVVAQGLQVVDMTASILAKENRIPLRVFALQEKDSIIRAVSGDFNGTTVTA